MNSLSLKAVHVGQKVLAGLEKAHQRAREAHEARKLKNRHMIISLAAIDQREGRPARGRAGRIARKLGGVLHERSVKRYLDKLSGYDATRSQQPTHQAKQSGSRKFRHANDV